MIRENDLLKLIKYATQAPSGHNTQPWKFKPGKSSITILPDFKRALPVADSHNHELYISIGCALENLKIAAGAFGYKTKVELHSSNAATKVVVHFDEDTGPQSDQLFNYIDKRQVRRNLYDKQKVPENIIMELVNVCDEKSIQIIPFLTPDDRELLTPLILEAVSLQTGKKEFMNELINWTRFTEKEAVKHGDGLWTATLKLPNLGRLLGTLLFRWLVTPRSEMTRWKKVIFHTPCFMLFTVEKNDPQSWIKLGQVFQRFALTATKYGLSHAHANMPCEEGSVRKKMIGSLNLKESTPLLLIRLGYSQPMPYSFRRHLTEVITR